MGATSPPPRQQSGLALIEVLMAFVILSVALIGFSGLQLRAAKAAQSSLQRTDAVILAGSMLETMRANRWVVGAMGPGYWQYNNNLCTVPAAGATLSSNDLHDWFDSLKKTLGSSACGSIICTGAFYCTVEITWDDSRALGGAAAQKFQMGGAL